MVALTKKNNDLIIVVSGLPRSGTSLMMQILQAAGVPLLVDNVRQSDVNNPRGYFEYQAVKNLKNDNQWLKYAKGKAVKIISHLLYHLPAEFQYKVIFMNRNLDEIIASQNRMLKNVGKVSEIDDDTLKRHYAAHLFDISRWLTHQKNVQVRQINFHHLFEKPQTELAILSDFLNIAFNTEQIQQVIQPELYRTKINGH
ncbi:sulfotransferase domain-containing protein [Calditrichota bacterium GD2]